MISAIIWRGYAFGAVTSVIFLPLMVWMAENLLSSMVFSWQEIVTAFLIVYAVCYVWGRYSAQLSRSQWWSAI